jgi:hypothetical protein
MIFDDHVVYKNTDIHDIHDVFPIPTFYGTLKNLKLLLEYTECTLDIFVTWFLARRKILFLFILRIMIDGIDENGIGQINIINQKKNQSRVVPLSVYGRGVLISKLPSRIEPIIELFVQYIDVIQRSGFTEKIIPAVQIWVSNRLQNASFFGFPASSEKLLPEIGSLFLSRIFSKCHLIFL